MSPRHISLTKSTAPFTERVHQVPRSKVAVKLRPDQYSSKMVDITRVGRKVVKVTRLKKEDIIRYEKLKKEPPPPSLNIGMVPSPSTMTDHHIHMQIEKYSVKKVLEEAMENNNNGNVVVKSICDDEAGLATFECNEIVSSDGSLGLVLTESEDDDDELDDAQENDSACNLVEDGFLNQVVPRRILLRSMPRKEKIKFGFSKFEFKNNTLNLDRFLIPQPHPKRRLIRLGMPSLMKDGDPSVEGPVALVTESKPDVIGGEPSSEEVTFGAESSLKVIEVGTPDLMNVKEVSVQNETAKIVIDENPKAENDYVKGLIDEECNVVVDDGLVEPPLLKELDEVRTAGNLLINEDRTIKANTTKLFQNEYSTFLRLINRDPDEEGKTAELFVEDETVTANESVLELDLDKEKSFEKTNSEEIDNFQVDDSQSVPELYCKYPVIIEDNQDSENNMISDGGAATEELFKKEDDQAKSVVENIFEENHSFSLGQDQLCEDEAKPDDVQVLLSSPSAEDFMHGAGEDGKIISPQEQTKAQTKSVLSALSSLDLTAGNLEKMTDEYKKEINTLQTCLAVWTITASQTRLESILTSSLEISQVNPSVSKCVETFLPPAPPGQKSKILEARSKYFPVGETNEFKSSSPYPTQEPNVNLSPVLSSPTHDNISELLTPSCIQLQSYLSDAVVSDVDLEVLAKLNSSPDVIITEVPSPNVKIDSENNVVDEKKFENVEANDDSDSDVVLLSDDETDLCSPTSSLTSITSWQLNILSQTWQAWPIPNKAILFHLCLETGLSEDAIRDWFLKRTDQELVRVWEEFENV